MFQHAKYECPKPREADNLNVAKPTSMCAHLQLQMICLSLPMPNNLNSFNAMCTTDVWEVWGGPPQILKLSFGRPRKELLKSTTSKIKH